MVLKQMIRAIRFLIFPFLVLFFSCEEQGWIVKCPDCTVEEPVEAVLRIRLSIVNYDYVRVSIYEGELEDNILIGWFDTHSDTETRTVSLNKMYTVTADYLIEGVSYRAVNSAIPRVKYEKSQCDEPCYFIYDSSVDLRLKYLKGK